MRLRDSISMAALIAGLVAIAPNAHAASLQNFKHIVVIYQENHSFDNLYGHWGDVDEELVNGPQNATPARTKQVRQDNVTQYQCLLQNDVNLTSPPLAQSCSDTSIGTTTFKSAFKNEPFFIDNYIAATDSTCPAPGVFAANGLAKGSAGALPGGCTKDIVHRFYSEQYQLNGGKQNRYLTGSDASGLTMGAYNTKKL